MRDGKSDVVAWMGDDLIAPLVTEKQHAFFRDRGLTTDEWPIPLVPESLLLDARAGWDECALNLEGERIKRERAEALAGEYERDARRYRILQDMLYRDDISIGEATLLLKVTGACPDRNEFDTAIDAVGGRGEG